ncbi:UDP-N-acetylglucosamine 2-epimerase [Gammaproteobacteria bacterium]|nr:UDP-N-acetylglucosamine 2-epimerase [Gammaproteobacteria bacterium]
MNRKVCVITGSRAEFGLLRCLMQELQEQSGLELQLIATGMHLSPEFGLTFREIEQAGFAINEKVEMLLSADTTSAVTKSMGLGMIGFADAFERLSPDLIVVLGDRFEIFVAAAAAVIARIPLAHLHGGETTEGAFDEPLRHCITKMSHLHFVAADDYRRRVIQLGEHPERVFNVGGLGIDAIQRIELLEKAELEHTLDFKFSERNLLITFHPVTLEGSDSSEKQMSELLAALGKLDDTSLLFTMPNADTGGRKLTAMLDEFVATRENAHLFASLGQIRYLSFMKYVDAVVGNSSSGLTEAPSMGIATVNIGNRQKGRLMASSVVSCDATRESIAEAIATALNPSFQSSLCSVVSPYGEGGASKKIVSIIKKHAIEGFLKKTFFDLEVTSLWHASQIERKLT